jgi:hypothetical protein
MSPCLAGACNLESLDQICVDAFRRNQTSVAFTIVSQECTEYECESVNGVAHKRPLHRPHFLILYATHLLYSASSPVPVMKYIILHNGISS